MTHENDDQLEASPSEQPALTRAHVIAEHSHKHAESHEGNGAGGSQYELYEEHKPLLPGQILTDTIARLRFTIVLVSFFYSGLCFIVGILAVCLIAPNLLYMMDQTSPILLHTARVMIALVSFALGAACLLIIFKQRELTGKLALAEVMIDDIRDMALIQMQATRYTLEDLTDRLKFNDHHQASPFDYIELAKRIGPVVSLLLAKERSVVTIAMEGLKLFQVVKKVLNK
jgi:hypothetical protein